MQLLVPSEEMTELACPLCLEAWIDTENRVIRCHTCNKRIDIAHTYFVIGPKGFWHADCYLDVENPNPRVEKK